MGNETDLVKCTKATHELAQSVCQHDVEMVNVVAPVGHVLQMVGESTLLQGNGDDKQGGKYAQIIDLLEEAGDASHGVVWHRGSGDEENVLVRDARNATPPDNQSPYSYLIHVTNMVRAATRILEQQKGSEEAIKELNDELKGLIKDALPKILNNEQIEFASASDYNTHILNVLKKAKVKGAEKALATAKDLCHLEDKQYDVATIFLQKDDKGKEHVAIKSSVRVLGLTKTQEGQYGKIKESKGVQISLEGAGTADPAYKWYNGQSDTTRKLIANYAEKGYMQGKVVPTQLRKELIGLRNAHSDSLLLNETIGNPPEKGNWKVLQQNALHSGTPSFHGKGNRQEIATENMRQLQQVVPEGQSLNVVSLNSPGNPWEWLKNLFTGNSVEIGARDQVKAAVNTLRTERGNGSRITFSLNPLNWFRRFFSRREDEPFKKALSELGEQLKEAANSAKDDSPLKNLNVIGEFLQSGKDIGMAKMTAMGTLNGEMGNVLLRAINAKQNLSSSRWFIFDRGNRNLDLLSDMEAVSQAVNNKEHPLGSALSDYKMPVYAKYCASGKDRSRVSTVEADRKLLYDALNGNAIVIDSSIQRENLKLQITAGHYQKLTSINGGSPGAHGIKSDTAGAIPDTALYKGANAKKILVLQTAKLNKLKIVDKTKLKSLSLEGGVKKQVEVNKKRTQAVGLSQKVQKTINKGCKSKDDFWVKKTQNGKETKVRQSEK